MSNFPPFDAAYHGHGFLLEQSGSGGGRTMSVVAPSNEELFPRAKSAETLQYRIIFATCFFVLLWASLIERAIPQSWKQGDVTSSRPPFFTEVTQAAHRCTALAFAG